ncbi:MAG: outer membrane protein assembly factor BamA, partial [Desulfovibrionaceae bacterium]|nr:outer membrane protein assembly factor BamA [Desulfovibrionaceae bacterium]
MLRIFKFASSLAIIAICTVAFSSIADAQQGNAPRSAVVILPFEVHGDQEAQAAGEELPTMLATRLAARGIPVPDPAQVKQIISQHNINVGDIANMRRFGQAVRASHIVYGTLNQLGDDVSIDARILRVSGDSSPQPVYIDQEGSLGIAPAVDELAGRIFNSVANRQVLHDVEVRGLNVLDPDIVITRLTVRKGDPVDANAIDQEVRRIWDLGYFDDVRANLEQRPAGLVLVYDISEKPRIENIIVEGNNELDSDDILETMSTRAGSILNDKVLVQDLQKITELYREEGFYQAKISHRVQGSGPSASLVIEIEEGNELYIKEVRIEGAEQISESELKDELALQERGLLSWFTGTGVLREEYRDRDTAAIQAYYLDHGFLRVAVSSPDVVYEEDGIIVTFLVREGPRYKLGEVTFEGDLIEPQESLALVTELDDLARDGEYFNLTMMQDDAKKLMDYYGDYG